MMMKEQLVNLLNEAYEELEKYMARLPAEERLKVGQVDSWSVKDTLAHAVAWVDIMAKRMEILLDGGMPENITDFDEYNATLFKRHQNDAWQQIEALVDNAYSDLLSQITQISEEDLTDPERFEWRPGLPLWQSIVSNAFEHPIQHLGDLYLAEGDPVSAEFLLIRASQTQLALDESPDWQAATHYNLACYYALQGTTDKAVEGLEMAFSLNPKLKEWSKEDSDIDGIRDNPAYQALISSE